MLARVEITALIATFSIPNEYNYLNQRLVNVQANPADADYPYVFYDGDTRFVFRKSELSFTPAAVEYDPQAVPGE